MRASRVTGKNIRVTIDYQVLFIHGVADYQAGAPGFPMDETAVDDATRTGRHIGRSYGLLALHCPGQSHIDARMRIEVWDEEPARDLRDWDFVADVGGLVVSGGLVFFRGSGGHVADTVPVPDGVYRTRISGAGYASAGGEHPGDHYRFQLWSALREGEVPRQGAVLLEEPTVLRQWPGWPEGA